MKLPKPLDDARFRLTLTLANQLLATPPAEPIHHAIWDLQAFELPPLNNEWAENIAESKNPYQLMTAYSALRELPCLQALSNQLALLEHTDLANLPNMVRKALEKNWDEVKIDLLFQTPDTRSMFQIIDAQGEDRRLLPLLSRMKNPALLARLYDRVKSFNLDNVFLMDFLSTAKKHLTNSMDRLIEAPLLKEKSVLEFLVHSQFNFSSIFLVAELRAEDLWVLNRWRASLDDFTTAYAQAKQAGFLSPPMLNVLIKVENPQQMIDNMRNAAELGILGSELLPLFEDELPETKIHLMRLKQLKEQGKLNVSTFKEFMQEIKQNAKQPKPQEGISITEVSLFSHTKLNPTPVIAQVIPPPAAAEPSPEAKTTRRTRSVKR